MCADVQEEGDCRVLIGAMSMIRGVTQTQVVDDSHR
jgi:hypothetical protein